MIPAQPTTQAALDELAAHSRRTRLLPEMTRYAGERGQAIADLRLHMVGFHFRNADPDQPGIWLCRYGGGAMWYPCWQSAYNAVRDETCPLLGTSK